MAGLSPPHAANASRISHLRSSAAISEPGGCFDNGVPVGRQRGCLLQTLRRGEAESGRGYILLGDSRLHTQVCRSRVCIYGYPYDIRTPLRSSNTDCRYQQAGLSDPVQSTPAAALHSRHPLTLLAMGLPQQAEPRPQEPRPRRPPSRTMGAELHTEGHGGYAADRGLPDQ